ncbi:SDR family oxidoreductase [Rhodococcus spelaei]|uniref:SDR family oxidoreductase n=1 Tax=Rhodococcus spelaei TaxID=2546320 RepID=A0A541B7P6_9NOCA|nr:SDR family NAD(P)-dependent oxidoreductase [Rhodococcus spelaei]TQF68347.1 SDR family oxidoreductase [Rhodococcus spelaei]
MNRLEGKKVVITGAASGIGRAAAQLMAAEGAQVLVADLHESAAEQTAREIRESGATAVGVGVDVMDEAAVASMIDRAVAEFGGITTLCNHVGGSNPHKDLDLLRLDLDEWDRVMALNVRSTVVASRLAIPHMIEAGGGSIVNTASVGGLLGDSLQCAYGSAKAAVIRLTQYIATQYGRQGIRCNAVAPGAIMTPALRDNLPADVVAGIQAANALDMLGSAEDIGYAMVYLASDESRYMSGQTLVVDGGMTAQSPLAAGRRSMLGD